MPVLSFNADAERLLGGLTAAQHAAVISTAAPLCVLAGAGSGKTKVLTRRIAYRALAESADPRHVLALTFTRKAASELSERVEALGIRRGVATGTFHSIAFAQLRRWWTDRRQPTPHVLDRKSRLLGPIAAERPALAGVSLADLAGEIEWAKARSLTPDSYAELAVAGGRRLPAPPSHIASLFARYEHEKRRRRIVDFDDLLGHCIAAIETDSGFAAAQRWQWRHLFVDEFQDLNPLQHRLLLAWMGNSVDLCVVGDSNQSIYGWNGADPALLTDVAAFWPTTEVIRLNVNHRSSPQVVQAAAAVLGIEGVDLQSSQADGPSPAVQDYFDDQAEAAGVARELKQAGHNGTAWSQMAVLARTNAQLHAFEVECAIAGVPVKHAGATTCLENPVVKEYLEQLTNSSLPLDMVLADIEAYARISGNNGADGDGEIELNHCDADGSERNNNAERTPLRVGARTAVAQPLMAALALLGRQYCRLAGSHTLTGWLDWLDVAAGEDPTSATDTVTLSTFHRAKGLEWKMVWVTGLEEGLVPIGAANTAGQHDEERRLLYVALTRAGRDLHCSWAQRRRFGRALVRREPSPWLALIEQSTGQDQPSVSSEQWATRVRAARSGLSGSGLSGSGLSKRAAFGTPDTGDGNGLPPAHQPTLEALRRWRSNAARAAGVPPHVLFHDSTLRALASLRPDSEESLLGVPGLGPVKISRYGVTLLDLLHPGLAS